MKQGTVVIVWLTLTILLAGCGGGSGKSAAGPVSVQLSEQNSSGESGTATLTADGDRTRVAIQLQGEAAGASQPAHIHKGSCDKLDPTPAYGLPNVVGGKSDTEVAASLDQLENGSYAINVHKSNADLQTYVACGDVGEGGGAGGGGTGY
ncbi:MAG TPA: CHRD domain-containing protein [Gaiellaceae bacterium]|nr:CHRD domain-containing protein [Gaiellaceae bacterium]